MKKIVPLCCLLLLASCGFNTPSIKKYYFPYAEFTTPKVYQYTAQHDSSISLYWHFTTTGDGTDTFLTIRVYNPDFILTEVFKEKIGPEFSELTAIEMRNDTGMVEGVVDQNMVFKWIHHGEQGIYFSFKYPSLYGEQQIIKERSIANSKHDLTYKGDVYEAIRFDDEFTMNLKTPNRTQTTEQHRNSYYAEGIGLIAFETFYPNGTSNYFNLRNVLSEKEFDALRSSPKDTLPGTKQAELKDGP